MRNPNDRIRDAILRHLYDVHQRARGPRAVAIGIKKLQQAMKVHGIKQSQVNSNVDYLVQKGWVRRVVEERRYTTPGGTLRSSEKVAYKVSDVGIDRLESASTYQRPAAITGVNITNIRGVTVVGTGNIVNTELADLARLVTELEHEVGAAEALDETERLSTLADLGTIQTQLSKPKPDIGIVRRAWSKVEAIATFGEVVDLVGRIGAIISGVG
ncbi:MAG: hypothetical protein F4Y41_20475 [Gammaproteobacteria bacterium]|nr:hypothetical protein [Gammaproteobacteria bacterium]MYI05925.1 hypothetical protein [Gemmatimonadota bacterium]